MRGAMGILGVLLMAACASGPRGRVTSAVAADDLDGALEAYDEIRRSEGADAELLGDVAALILIREAHGEDDARRRAALTQLSLAGTRGEPLLREIAGESGTGPARLGALRVLASRGGEAARLSLRALADHDDPAILAMAVLGMDPSLDQALLLEHCGAEDPGLRAAAIRALAPAAAEERVRERLATVARVDAVASVRAAAVRSLRGAGASASDALRERLGDPESSVRLAAVGALVAADPGAARAALAPLLEVAISPAGIEAARLLADDEDATTATGARRFLRRALTAQEASLRIQAGVALTGLPRATEAPMDAVREALGGESSPAVQLAFARALRRRDDPVARRTLIALLSGSGMPQVQAAALLAADDEESARQVLTTVLRDLDQPSLSRRTAARALARDAMRPDAARGALRDEDALVRIFAAGGILAAAAAS